MKRHIAMTVDAAIENSHILDFENEKGESATLEEKITYLNDLKSLEHVFINITDCDNFCPFEGCLGHE